MHFDKVCPRSLLMAAIATNVAMVVFMAVPFSASATQAMPGSGPHAAMTGDHVQRGAAHAPLTDPAGAHQRICPALHDEFLRHEHRASVVPPVVWYTCVLPHTMEFRSALYPPEAVGDSLLRTIGTVIKLE